jgi:hypothetical protein
LLGLNLIDDLTASCAKIFISFPRFAKFFCVLFLHKLSAPFFFCAPFSLFPDWVISRDLPLNLLFFLLLG